MAIRIEIVGQVNPKEIVRETSKIAEVKIGRTEAMHCLLRTCPTKAMHMARSTFEVEHYTKPILNPS